MGSRTPSRLSPLDCTFFHHAQHCDAPNSTARLKAFAAVTDGAWFRFLSAQPGIDEVNFWQPGGGRGFRALAYGEPLLFKLKSPHNAIAGGGFFAHFARLPVSVAWDMFGSKNGAATFAEMRTRIESLRGGAPTKEDYPIGCITLVEPFFLRQDRWIPTPESFHPATQVGKLYDLETVEGRDLWLRVNGERALAQHRGAERPVEILGPMFGEAQRMRIRLGQGAFRVIVTDAYERRCAISGEKALPVLQAAHIKPVADGGQHRLDNGLLLRSDVHTLYDRGYITVTPDHRVLVASKKLKEDFDNGEPYVPFHGSKILVPAREVERPAPDLLEWHANTVFRG